MPSDADIESTIQEAFNSSAMLCLSLGIMVPNITSFRLKDFNIEINEELNETFQINDDYLQQTVQGTNIGQNTGIYTIRKFLFRGQFF